MARPSVLLVLASLASAEALAQDAPRLPVRDPSFASDGRLAASIEGDIWVRQSNGRTWIQITRGPAWDRQPACSADGPSLVFVSNREGQDDLFRVAARRDATVERITTAPAADLEPAVGRDGTIYFARGRGNEARLW